MADKGNKIDWYNIDKKFAAHEPKAQDTARYKAINEPARNFAQVLADNMPENSDEARHAIKAVQEAVLWAKDAIRTWKPAQMVETGMFSHGLFPAPDTTSLS